MNEKRSQIINRVITRIFRKLKLFSDETVVQLPLNHPDCIRR